MNVIDSAAQNTMLPKCLRDILFDIYKSLFLFIGWLIQMIYKYYIPKGTRYRICMF